MLLSKTVALIAALAATAATDAALPAGPFLPLGRIAEAPRGFVRMCQANGTFCGAAAITGGTRLATAGSDGGKIAEGDPTRVSATVSSGELAQLTTVNHFVNARVTQRTDYQIYGRDEQWQRSGTGRKAAGDCEDIAIEKRFALVTAGFPADRLSFAVVYMRGLGLHTVLLARTANGDMVLDSRSPYLTRWDRTGYSWISIQSMVDAGQWRALGTLPLQMAQQESAPTG